MIVYQKWIKKFYSLYYIYYDSQINITHLTQNMSSLNDFIVLGKIGEGAYSSVHKVKRISDENIYALKKVSAQIKSRWKSQQWKKSKKRIP